MISTFINAWKVADLRKIGDTSVQPKNPQTEGKIKKIAHLIEATEE